MWLIVTDAGVARDYWLVCDACECEEPTNVMGEGFLPEGWHSRLGTNACGGPVCHYCPECWEKMVQEEAGVC